MQTTTTDEMHDKSREHQQQLAFGTQFETLPWSILDLSVVVVDDFTAYAFSKSDIAHTKIKLCRILLFKNGGCVRIF